MKKSVLFICSLFLFEFAWEFFSVESIAKELNIQIHNATLLDPVNEMLNAMKMGALTTNSNF